MRLSDLVQIDSRFEKSVNLLLDLYDRSKINAYIPTRSSVNLLKRFLNEVTGFSGGRANILIGPYGKGKSHLLLVLMAILSGNSSDELNCLIKKVDPLNHEISELIRVVNNSYRFLPVIINTNSGNLSQALVRSLNQALIREGLNDIVPDSYFTEAVKTIRLWKEMYPSTYGSFEKLIDSSVEGFVNRLNDYDYDAIDLFRECHPLVTSGSEFNPIINDETISVYRSINRIICEKYNYSGIYIIFDEFSKYIEGHIEETFSSDMKVLQDICELCNSSNSEQLHLTCVAHKAIRSYGDSLSKNILNAFRGVEGRLVEVPFVVSSQNNYELIADVIHKKKEFTVWKSNHFHQQLLEDSYSTPEFSALFEKNDFESIVGDGCFPLTAIATLLLMNLSEKIAQNERTIFTFLSGKDFYSLNEYIANCSDVSYAGASLIYDYFQPLFEGENNTPIHYEWLKADYALSKTDDIEEQIIVKSLAIIKMVNRSDDIPSNDLFLYLASGLGKGAVANSIQALIEKEIIVFRKNTRTYDFQNKIGINIENVVSDYALKYYSKVDVISVLNDVFRKRYILPKKYNQDHFMTRYYRVIFMAADTFIKLMSASYLTDENEPDGYLLILYGDCNSKDESIKLHVKEINDNRIVIGIPGKKEDLSERVRSLLAVRRLIGDKDFISENEVLLTELKLLESDLVAYLNEWMDEAVLSIEVLLTASEAFEVQHHGINRAISDICENVYNCTPIINHELINRHQVSAQISKARNSIMYNILHGMSMEQYNSGTSAESTIYRALMVQTKNDENLPLIKKEILYFIHDSKGRKNPFSTIVNKLADAPYGMRKGPMPVFFTQQLIELEDMPVVYLGNKELSIDASLMTNIMRNPEDYSLYVEEETVQKLEYIENLEKLFSEYSSYCRGIENRNRLSKLACIIQAWFRSLPQISMTFRKQDYIEQDVKKVISFRKLFGGVVNPREVLFDKLPALFDASDFLGTYKEVESVKLQLDNHIIIIKHRAIDAIRKKLMIDKDDNLLLGLKDWYSKLSDKIKNSVFSADSQRLLGCIRSLDVTDEEEIAEKLSKAITGFFIEDWNDHTIQLFESGFEALLGEIEDKIKSVDTSIGQKVVFSTDDGLKECLYDFDPDNLSASGYFFQNALDDMLEEYGESLENSEKIGILMQVIKKLMG